MKAGVQRIFRDRYRTAVAWLVESQTQAEGSAEGPSISSRETASSKVKDLLQLVVSAASQGPL